VGRFLKIASLTVVVGAVLFAGLAVWALPTSYPPMPALAGTIERGTLEHGGRTRSWIAYRPAKPAASPALVIVLHASMGTAQQARQVFGYDFDRLADQQGFIVVYPQGYDGHWNDCKLKGPFAAKRENVDDVAFLHALVDRVVKDHHADRSRVYVTGVSNGGGMVLRLALQTPDFARAYAALVSSVPTPGNMAPAPKNQAVSILLMNGTNDPFNPWRGGDVVLYGIWGNRGPVLSAQASIDYFRNLAGLQGAPQVTQFPDRDPGDGSTVERSLWSAPGKRSVALYTIKGGGHAVPNPATYGRRLLGHVNRDIHAADEIWDFFRSASN
jgi:polyhydroxybutyrate depolymerase